jgi:hypothetical protein
MYLRRDGHITLKNIPAGATGKTMTGAARAGNRQVCHRYRSISPYRSAGCRTRHRRTRPVLQRETQKQARVQENVPVTGRLAFRTCRRISCRGGPENRRQDRAGPAAEGRMDPEPQEPGVDRLPSHHSSRRICPPEEEDCYSCRRSYFPRDWPPELQVSPVLPPGMLRTPGRTLR